MRTYTVAEYHALISNGVLTTDDRVELLEGVLVPLARQTPPHCSTLNRLCRLLLATLPDDWQPRVRSGVTLSDSEPEPDLAIVRGGPRTYVTRHPTPADFGIVVEVSDSTLDADRRDKGRIYARAGVPEYWIVNLPDARVEVYTQPQTADPTPAYATRTDYAKADAVPLTLDGHAVAHVPVADLLP
jgi:Uma2 family endonuclease